MNTSPSQRFAAGVAAALFSITLFGAGRGESQEGSKPRVAVAGVEAAGALTAATNGWDVGPALAAQLTTELVGTGRLIVVERAALEAVLDERQLGAQFLVAGVVTEFSESAAGRGLRLHSSRTGLGIGLGTSVARVGLDLRLIDVATGQVVYAFPVQGEARSRSVTVDAVNRGVQWSPEVFSRTPLGVASRQALREAAVRIAAILAESPRTGRQP